MKIGVRKPSLKKAIKASTTESNQYRYKAGS